MAWPPWPPVPNPAPPKLLLEEIAEVLKDEALKDAFATSPPVCAALAALE
jgi:hypothetical protein